MVENNSEKKEVKIPEMYLRKIEQVIGMAVDPSDENKFSSFQEVDDLTRSRAREICNQIDELRAERYLKYLISDNLGRYVFSFLTDVITGSMEEEEWIRKNFGEK